METYPKYVKKPDHRIYPSWIDERPSRRKIKFLIALCIGLISVVIIIAIYKIKSN